MPDSVSERRSTAIKATKFRKTETKSRRRGAVIRAFWAPSPWIGGLELCGMLSNSALALSRVTWGGTFWYVERRSIGLDVLFYIVGDRAIFARPEKITSSDMAIVIRIC